MKLEDVRKMLRGESAPEQSKPATPGLVNHHKRTKVERPVTAELLARTRLEFKAGKSDKVYIVAVVRVEPEVYRVEAQWGRRTAPTLQGGVLSTHDTESAARNEAARIVEKKTRQGYINKGMF